MEWEKNRDLEGSDWQVTVLLPAAAVFAYF